jgi:hypothetical protein
VRNRTLLAFGLACLFGAILGVVSSIADWGYWERSAAGVVAILLAGGIGFHGTEAGLTGVRRRTHGQPGKPRPG